MTTIYTPGHGLVTDTLIMHGVVRVLAHMGIYDMRVRRLGERYEITFDGKPKKIADTDIAELMQLSANKYLEEKRAVGPLRKIQQVNINVAARVFGSWVSDLAQAILNADITDLTQDHKERRREGRTTSKTLNTLHIALSSVYGKYAQRDYSVRGNLQYGVCDTCFTLANIGLVYGAAALVARKADRHDVIFMSVAPADEIDGRDLLVMQRLTEGYRIVGEEMPLLAAPIYWLSTGETLYATDAELDLVIWRNVRSGNFLRSLDATTINLERLAKFIAEAKHYLRNWPRIVEDLARNAPETLAKLTEYVLFGGDPYAVARELATIRCGEQPCIKDLKKLIDVFLGFMKKQ